MTEKSKIKITRPVQRKMKKLINKFGSPSAVAVLLNVNSRYIEMLRDGKANPGRHLFDKLVELAEGK